MYRMRTPRINAPYWRIATTIILSVVLLVMTACGDDETTEDVAAETTVTPDEVEPGFEPELMFSIEITDENTLDSVAFAPDGELIAVGTYLEAHLINPSDGSEVRVVEFNHSVDDLEFSPDGGMIAAGQGVGGVQINNVTDGSEVIQLHAGYNNYLSISPDGETIATGNRDGMAWIWDIESGEQLAEFSPPAEEWVLSLAFSPDGTMLAHGDWEGDVFLWNVEAGDLMQTLQNPEESGYAYDLSYSPNGEYLAVAGARDAFDNVARIWNVGDGTEHGIVGAESETRAVDYAPDGELLAVGSGDGFVLVDPVELSEVFRYEFDVEPGESNWVTGVAFDSESRFLAVSYWNGTLELWRVQE